MYKCIYRTIKSKKQARRFRKAMTREEKIFGKRRYYGGTIFESILFAFIGSMLLEDILRIFIVEKLNWV